MLALGAAERFRSDEDQVSATQKRFLHSAHFRSVCLAHSRVATVFVHHVVDDKLLTVSSDQISLSRQEEPKYGRRFNPRNAHSASEGTVTQAFDDSPKWLPRDQRQMNWIMVDPQIRLHLLDALAHDLRPSDLPIAEPAPCLSQ